MNWGLFGERGRIKVPYINKCILLLFGFRLEGEELGEPASYLCLHGAWWKAFEKGNDGVAERAGKVFFFQSLNWLGKNDPILLMWGVGRELGSILNSSKVSCGSLVSVGYSD